MPRAKKTNLESGKQNVAQEPEVAETGLNDGQKREAGDVLQDAGQEIMPAEANCDTGMDTETADTGPDNATEPEAAETGLNGVQELDVKDVLQDTGREIMLAKANCDTGMDTETADTGPDDATEPDVFTKLPNPCVYCGPSVKGIARQYTTFQGGLPDAMKKFIREHPDAMGLIVSTGKFPAMRKKLDTVGTPEAKLYKKVREEI